MQTQKVINSAAALVAVFGASSALATDVIFDNYFGDHNGTANGGAYFGYAPGFFGGPPQFAPVTEIANRFDVSGGDFTLEAIEATMFWFDELLHENPINDGVILRVHESSNGLPGAVLATVSALGPLELPPSNGPVATANPIMFDFSGAGIVLQDGSSYWLSAEAANGGFAVWGAALAPDSDPLDPTILGPVSGYQAERWNGDMWDAAAPDFGAFRVSGSLVPVPGTAATLPLACLMTARRRRPAS